jgi:hypothetical protein
MRPFKFKKPRDVELSANMGHQRTFHDVRVASALPPKADIRQRCCDVSFGPEADIRRQAVLFDRTRRDTNQWPVPRPCKRRQGMLDQALDATFALAQ